MKQLNGQELAEYVKERQAKQVRGLRQAHHIFPRLSIVMTNETPVISTYVRLKERYGQDILVAVDIHRVAEADAAELVERLNKDDAVHGIIVQLPLVDPTGTDALVDLIAPEKDVDSLGTGSKFDAATPLAINWLLTGYGVDLVGKRIVIVGEGRLVGAPLARMWRNSGLEPTVVAEPTAELSTVLENADIIVSATGVPSLITSDMIRPGTVIVDAGTSTEGGRIVGDVADDVRDRHDILTTPARGGVGPLTICALFDNVIRSARSVAENQT